MTRHRRRAERRAPRGGSDAALGARGRFRARLCSLRRLATPGDGRGSDTRVRVQDLRLGVSTSWSLEKFESKLAAMKELYEVRMTVRPRHTLGIST